MEETVKGFELVPFSADHAYEIILHPDTGIDKESEIFEQWVEVRCCGGGWTVLYEDDIVCCGGITPVWAGVGNAWFLRSVHVQCCPIATVKLSMIVIDRCTKQGNYHRVQCEVRKDSASDIRFAHYLGFETEGIMRKWGADGSDYLLMARIR